MDSLPKLFDLIKKKALATGNFLGFIYVFVGRRVKLGDGTLVSKGMTWRELSTWLKKLRWDPEAVRELNLDPDSLPPRDRERFWYTAISRADIGSTRASEAGDKFAAVLRQHGYEV